MVVARQNVSCLTLMISEWVHEKILMSVFADLLERDDIENLLRFAEIPFV